jgi:hypothetical protein
MKTKIFLISILLFLITGNSAYSFIRIGTFGDSITLGNGFKTTIDDVERSNLGGYRYSLVDYFERGGFDVDMVGLWGKEPGDAYWYGEEASYKDNNYLLAGEMDMDHTSWGGAQAEYFIDYFIDIDAAEQLFPIPNQEGSSMIIHIGTNNVNAPIDESISHVERLIAYMDEHDPTVNLIICQIIPSTYSPFFNFSIDLYNDALQILVDDLSETQENLFLVDLNTPLRENWELVTADKLHPNNQGYRIMADILYMAMLYNDIIPSTCGGSEEIPCDMDNDTVTDPSDNCPTISNIDQQDVDNDTVGDACDLCPNDPNNDEDSDGVCGDVDNCIGTPNPTQKNADEDGKGDVCDADTVYGSMSGAVKEGIFVGIYKSACGGDVLETSTITDLEGYYSIGNLGDARYLIVPEDTSYSFNPSYWVDIAQTEIQSFDFTATSN